MNRIWINLNKGMNSIPSGSRELVEFGFFICIGITAGSLGLIQMNDITVFIYLMGFAAVFGMTCVYFFMMMRSTLNTFDKKPVKSYDDTMRAYRMPAPHPEMEGVQFGEELMVFTPEEEDEDDDGDPIISR